VGFDPASLVHADANDSDPGLKTELRGEDLYNVTKYKSVAAKDLDNVTNLKSVATEDFDDVTN
jgi:hypothetical protein